ncbi:Kinetochore protein ndc-80 [Caenorhabditis elegans]|uniref:Kinetochore protein ndc-80 n=1 Tax=Caenorhabditis elegans TaxID=6239 RepID=NDC80_CAEEL|nr:Kinetochore protein ndc-80 [Caenorhabditis elegans]Q17635.2 RecName: Full=Kinetochore protein ndc-80; Short=CeNDC-80; AltName: Full=Hec1 homolog [Caenorhabditis elegans]CAA92629.1 Kinetochore protein ndc-80 [Caenorhabditis elegans]|eukprot:NP_501830.1 Kinetochore protein ndc-80 [Caenorhabditis elegans]
MFGDRRKTGGLNLNGRASIAITPTKRFTDYTGSTSVRKTDARPSLSQPRVSLFNTKNSSVAPRDVKSLVSLNGSKIYNFLVEYESSDAPSEQLIMKPRGKNDFIACFELIYQHLSKDYEFPRHERIEEEVSQIFKGLGYPYPLKNSYYQPMGSSHGYPHLLDALSWLIDIIRINSAVSEDTQNILFGDFMEQGKAQEKTLNYAWMTSTFRDYTNDRKAAENPSSSYWDDTKHRLRKYFEQSNEFEDMTKTAASALEMLNYECDEIEADKGNEASLKEEISRIRDDIRKAKDYLEQNLHVKQHMEKELAMVKSEQEEKISENEKVQKMVDDLKNKIELQKQIHGLTGKEVRQMNLDNNKDKEVVLEIQSELDRLSKETWKLKDEDFFKEQKSKFIHLAEQIMKILSGLNIQMNLEPLRAPTNERDLKDYWETLNKIWVPEISRQLHQRKLELETEQSRFSNKAVTAEERIQIQSETLCEAKKNEAREERIRRNERDSWKDARKHIEQRYEQLLNEKEVLLKQMKLDGSLEKEIEDETARMSATGEEHIQKRSQLEAGIRQILDLMVVEIAEIENKKIGFHVQCAGIEKAVL